MSEVWGGQCFSDDDCFHVISRCDQDRGFTGATPPSPSTPHTVTVTLSSAADGECRLAWWVWLVAALLALLLLLSLLSCCCLPCCCLYSLCSGVIDFLCSCLCCCCSTRRGYTVARTG